MPAKLTDRKRKTSLYVPPPPLSFSALFLLARFFPLALSESSLTGVPVFAQIVARLFCRRALSPGDVVHESCTYPPHPEMLAENPCAPYATAHSSPYLLFIVRVYTIHVVRACVRALHVARGSLQLALCGRGSRSQSAGQNSAQAGGKKERR